MIFTNLARVIAWLAVIFGALIIGTAFYIIIGADDAASRKALASLFNKEDTGEMINDGVQYLLFGLVLGIMTDISRAVAAQKSSQPSAQTGKNEGRED